MFSRPEHGVETEAGADAQDGRTQGGVTFARDLEAQRRFLAFVQGPVLRAEARRPAAGVDAGQNG